MGIILAVKTCMTYFWYEKMDFSPPANPHVMVLTTISKFCFAILVGKGTRVIDK